MEKINRIIIHCLYTKPSMDWGVEEVRRVHVEEKGFSDIGYHVLIKFNGISEQGRRLDENLFMDASEIGAHAYGFNRGSIAIALEGGMSEDGEPEFNFTFKQIQALRTMVEFYMAAYGVEFENVIGHNEVSSKPCPMFNVRELLK
jgi:N-acetyl-anhydromuramyl-L-alanine amidase AmpD